MIGTTQEVEMIIINSRTKAQAPPTGRPYCTPSAMTTSTTESGKALVGKALVGARDP
jgi:hypothetical protein